MLLEFLLLFLNFDPLSLRDLTLSHISRVAAQRMLQIIAVFVLPWPDSLLRLHFTAARIQSFDIVNLRRNMPLYRHINVHEDSFFFRPHHDRLRDWVALASDFLRLIERSILLDRGDILARVARRKWKLDLRLRLRRLVRVHDEGLRGRFKSVVESDRLVL